MYLTDLKCFSDMKGHNRYFYLSFITFKRKENNNVKAETTSFSPDKTCFFLECGEAINTSRFIDIEMSLYQGTFV